VLELCAGKLACTVLRGLGPSNGVWPLGIVSLRHFLDWLASVFRSLEDLVLENWLSVGNCWLCTRNNLAVD
jgi:hypothetical protein